MTKNNVILGLIIIILLLSGACYLQYNSAVKEKLYRTNAENKAAAESAHYKADQKHLQNKFNQALAKHITDSTSAAHIQDSLENVANHFVAIFNSSKGVPKDTTQCCKVIPIITARAENAIQAKDVVITNLNSQKANNWNDFNNLLSIEQAKSLKSDSAYHAEQTGRLKLEGVEQQLKDEQAKDFGIGASIGYGATVYENKIVTGPVVSISLQWTPWRFSLKKKK